MSLLGAGYGGQDVNTRRITDGVEPQWGSSVVAGKTPTKAELARKAAEEHIQNGTDGIVDLILKRVEEAAKIGRFGLVHAMKNNEGHLKDYVINALRADGFKIDVGPTSQREPETCLNISW